MSSTTAMATRKRLTACMNPGCARELLERSREDDGQLKAEQGLSTGQDDPCLGEHLLGLGVMEGVGHPVPRVVTPAGGGGHELGKFRGSALAAGDHEHHDFVVPGPEEPHFSRR